MATILVVDDESPILALLRDLLEEEGHTVLAAHNAAMRWRSLAPSILTSSSAT